MQLVKQSVVILIGLSIFCHAALAGVQASSSSNVQKADSSIPSFSILLGMILLETSLPKGLLANTSNRPDESAQYDVDIENVWKDGKDYRITGKYQGFAMDMECRSIWDDNSEYTIKGKFGTGKVDLHYKDNVQIAGSLFGSIGPVPVKLSLQRSGKMRIGVSIAGTIGTLNVDLSGRLSGETSTSLYGKVNSLQVDISAEGNRTELKTRGTIGSGCPVFSIRKVWTDGSEIRVQGKQSAGEPGKAPSGSKGCISGNCTSGWGTYVWENGDTYTGSWQYGNRTGRGTYTSANGTKYCGEYNNNIREGQGTYYFAGGDYYTGQFHNHKMHGYGTYHYANGNENASIQWQDDKPIASAVKSSANEVGRCASGDCVNSTGVFVSFKGSRYEGTFLDGKLNGDAKVVYASGDYFSGMYVKGTRQGRGTYFWAKSGCKFDGEWQNNKRNGMGTYFNADGSIQRTGKWENDEYVGTGSSTENSTSDSSGGYDGYYDDAWDYY
jgi:hypothetical protein